MPSLSARARGLRILLGAALALAAAPAAGDVQGKDQQKCVNGLNKGGARVNQAQNRESFRCWQRYQKGQESSAASCWVSDPRQKVMNAAQKVFDQEVKLCSGGTPDFAYTSAFVVTTVGREQSLFFLEDLYGLSPDAAANLGASDAALGKCQQEAIKGGHQLEEALLKSANGAKKTYLKGTKQVPPAADAATLANMVASSVLGDTKLQKRAEKLQERLAKRCGELGGAPLQNGFPGCNTTSPSALSLCVAGAARCRGCNKLSQMDDLPLDCDLVDDFSVNLSCLPGGLLTPTPSATVTPTFGPTPTPSF